MNIRSTAIEWYQKHYGTKPKYFYSSKYFEAQESWSKTPVWWFQLPLQCLEEKLEPAVIFVSEIAPEQNDFYVLKIPTHYFIENLKGFTFLAEKSINLMLSAESQDKFRDVRGKGNIDFSQFLVREK